MTEPGRRPTASSRAPAPTLVVGCGALARELLELVERNGLAGAVDVRCLPAQLHNRPHEIAPAVDAKLAELAGDYDRVFVAYADCGTGGALDAVLARYDAERLPGAHCYATYAGLAEFVALAAEEPGTFYLTDFLARSFDALVVRGLGLDRHPELLHVYFAGYRRVVYLSQHEDPELLAMARCAATRLGLAFEHRPTGYGELGSAMARLAGGLTVGPQDAGARMDGAQTVTHDVEAADLDRVAAEAEIEDAPTGGVARVEPAPGDIEAAA
ncbi:MAG TPA: DUF1638 domain-containing protein [Candidatus Limnocylindrales bacterium]